MTGAIAELRLVASLYFPPHRGFDGSGSLRTGHVWPNTVGRASNESSAMLRERDIGLRFLRNPWDGYWEI